METERTMLDRLNIRYSKYNGNGVRYVRAEHVKSATGFDARRTCDYLIMDLWGGAALHGYEIKVSRADWLAELKDPSKAETFAKHCDYWWLVVSDKSIVKPGELPEGWGLMVASGATVRVSKTAERQEAIPMPRSMQAAYSRGIMKTTLRLATEGDQAVRWVEQGMNLRR